MFLTVRPQARLLQQPGDHDFSRLRPPEETRPPPARPRGALGRPRGVRGRIRGIGARVNDGPEQIRGEDDHSEVERSITVRLHQLPESARCELLGHGAQTGGLRRRSPHWGGELAERDRVRKRAPTARGIRGPEQQGARRVHRLCEVPAVRGGLRWWRRRQQHRADGVPQLPQAARRHASGGRRSTSRDPRGSPGSSRA